MKLIPLTQGYFTQVDDDDYGYLMQWKWYAQRGKNKYYAKRDTYTNINGNLVKKNISMGRAILKVVSPILNVIYKDGDGLNNQKNNLIISDKNPKYKYITTKERKERARAYWINREKNKQKRIQDKKTKRDTKFKKGVNHPYWKGGITSLRMLIIKTPKYKKWRKKCFERDDYTCMKCKIKGGKLHVHHKKTFSELLRTAIVISPLLSKFDACMIYMPFWDVNNGITLCVGCHKKTKTYGTH